jgi:hypothetical protein
MAGASPGHPVCRCAATDGRDKPGHDCVAIFIQRGSAIGPVRNSPWHCRAPLKPDDLAEIMIATRMLAAHHASMDSYRRSMRPGLCDADVSRLRANALATGRAADAAQRTLDKRKAPPKPPAEARPARKPPVPPHEDMSRIEAELARFTPEEIAAAEISLDNDPADLARNELAKRVSLDRFEDMTMEERRIAYAPRALMTPAEIAVMGKRIAESNRRPRPADEVAPGEPQARST